MSFKIKKKLETLIALIMVFIASELNSIQSQINLDKFTNGIQK